MHSLAAEVLWTSQIWRDWQWFVMQPGVGTADPKRVREVWAGRPKGGLW